MEFLGEKNDKIMTHLFDNVSLYFYHENKSFHTNTMIKAAKPKIDNTRNLKNPRALIAKFSIFQV